MKFEKGNHYDNNWLSTRPVFFERTFSKTYVFTDSCRYKLLPSDQLDANKLFGIAFFERHWESARFGWAYDPNRDAINIHAYAYTCGMRKNLFFCRIPVGLHLPVKLTLKVKGDYYHFEVEVDAGAGQVFKRSTQIERGGYSWPVFTLGGYFGGDEPAPHDIEIKEVKTNILKKWITKLLRRKA